MHQVLQNLNSGATELIDSPLGDLLPGHVQIASTRSLISAGTERMLVEFSRANLFAKARTQPERVVQVLDKVQSDGLLATMNAVHAKLQKPLPMGYCNAGVVLAVGTGVNRVAPGDRVASNGPHAEIVHVPENLCAKIPDGVSDEEAAFTALSAVALQGIRLLAPSLGERIVVYGLGLVGLLAAQILRASGCHVLGIDLAKDRLALAEQFGVTSVSLSASADPVTAGLAFSQEIGVDGVLITASSPSDQLVNQAAQMCRKRGRIILVGVVGLRLQRADFYAKELTFQVSCSYGPGRYDSTYEEHGRDYPVGFVRWTEQRNFQAILEMMDCGSLNVKPLITHRYPITQAPEAYQQLIQDPSVLGVLLTYQQSASLARSQRTTINLSHEQPLRSVDKQVTVGIIGAGAFTTGTLLRALAKTPARLKSIASLHGTSAALAARRFGIEEATTDVATIMADPAITALVITTRHDSHADLVTQALTAGKHVYVEKPLALDRDQLHAVTEVHESHPELHLMVGFNRRFVPLIQKMRELVADRTSPLCLVYTVNAGTAPNEHWVQDPAVGGGRIVGEACHFIDLLCYLAGGSITGVEARMMGGDRPLVARQDKMTITIELDDGSIATVHYFANGSRRFAKERIEIFGAGRVLVLDNFRTLRGYGWPGFRTQRRWRQEKGHSAALAAFVDRIRQGGPPLIPFSSLHQVSLATIVAMERAMKPACELI